MAHRALCLDPCLWGGPHLRFCRPIEAVPEPASPPNSPRPPSLCTWIPEGAELVVLMRAGPHPTSPPLATVVYIPREDTLYFARPEFALAPACPAGLAFLCQFTVDAAGAPRLLAVDLMEGEGGTGTVEAPPPPAARYGRLQGAARHLQAPSCMVQWCGEAQALTDPFLATLPHRVSGLLALTADPCRPRLLRRQTRCPSPAGGSAASTPRTPPRPG